MEREPSIDPVEELWRRYGRLELLMELRDAVNEGWNGYGVKLWVERELKKVEEEQDGSRFR